eukprot:g7364.t1
MSPSLYCALPVDRGKLSSCDIYMTSHGRSDSCSWRAVWTCLPSLLLLLPLLVEGQCVNDDTLVVNQNCVFDSSLRSIVMLKTWGYAGLAWLTGNLCSDSFLPPGKVGEMMGFQFTRDSEPNGLGHNSMFSDYISQHVFSLLTDEQLLTLSAPWREQSYVDLTIAMVSARQPLNYELRKLIAHPANPSLLNLSAVVSYWQDWQEMDGKVTIRRAKALGAVIRSLNASMLADIRTFTVPKANTPAQPTALWETNRLRFQRLGIQGGFTRTLWTGETMNDNSLLVTLGNQLMSWISEGDYADIYFAPEQVADLFGAFYLKDLEIFNVHAGSTVNLDETADRGQAFLDMLPPALYTKLAGVAAAAVSWPNGQLAQMYNIRANISHALRALQTGTALADEAAVLALFREHGRVDGELIAQCAKIFAEIYWALDRDGFCKLHALRPPSIPEAECPGAWFLASQIKTPLVHFNQTLPIWNNKSEPFPDRAAQVRVALQPQPMLAGPALQDPPVLTLANGSAIHLYATIARTNNGVFGFTHRAWCFNDTGNLACGAVGPTLKTAPGASFSLVLHNLLSMDPAGPATPNTLNSPNSTNLYFHTLQLRQEQNFSSWVLKPGEQMTLNLSIPADHAPGMHWYYSKPQGASALQVMSGMAGALWLESSSSPMFAGYLRRLLVVSHLQLNASVDPAPTDPTLAPLFETWSMQKLGATMQDLVRLNYTVNGAGVGTSNWLLVNGQLQPSLSLQPGKVMVCDIVHASGASVALRLTIVANGTQSPCGLYLLGLDGIMLDQRRGPVPFVTLPPGARRSLALQCGSVGTYFLQTNSPEFSQNLLTIVVAGVAVVEALPAAAMVAAQQPAYLADLRLEQPLQRMEVGLDQDTASASLVLGLGANCTIACDGAGNSVAAAQTASKDCIYASYDPKGEGSPWDGGLYQYVTRAGWLNEMVINGRSDGIHPLHLQGHALQVVGYDGPENSTLWFQLGDWLDVLPALPGRLTIRWRPSSAGSLTLGSTILRHRDQGLLDTLFVLPAQLLGGLPEAVGSIIIGRPTNVSFSLSLLARSSNVSFWARVGYWTPAGKSTTVAGMTEAVLVNYSLSSFVEVSSLPADTRVDYVLWILPLALSGGSYLPMPVRSLHTQRARGAGFVFTITADPHMYDPDAWSLATFVAAQRNIIQDQPDFHMDLGDTFMGHRWELWQGFLPGAAQLEQLYRDNHNFWSRTMSDAVPLLLVQGNHDAEAPPDLDFARMALNFRHRYFPNPAINYSSFYSMAKIADAQLPGNPPRDGWYSFVWGNVLLVALDVHWYRVTMPGIKAVNDLGWQRTLGDEQYNWLKDTLLRSSQKFKLIFTHNLVGYGAPDSQRGGALMSEQNEWGGHNVNGSMGFGDFRPRWSEPIHDLLLHAGVQAVFHGHDHLFSLERRDGLVYQCVPMPADPKGSSGSLESYAPSPFLETNLPNAGHLRVEVFESKLAVDYIRAVAPADENVKQGKVNGVSMYSYEIPATLFPLPAAQGTCKDWQEMAALALQPCDVSLARAALNSTVQADLDVLALAGFAWITGSPDRDLSMSPDSIPGFFGGLYWRNVLSSGNALSMWNVATEVALAVLNSTQITALCQVASQTQNTWQALLSDRAVLVSWLRELQAEGEASTPAVAERIQATAEHLMLLQADLSTNLAQNFTVIQVSAAQKTAWLAYWQGNTAFPTPSNPKPAPCSNNYANQEFAGLARRLIGWIALGNASWWQYVPPGKPADFFGRVQLEADMQVGTAQDLFYAGQITQADCTTLLAAATQLAALRQSYQAVYTTLATALRDLPLNATRVKGLGKELGALEGQLVLVVARAIEEVSRDLLDDLLVVWFGRRYGSGGQTQSLLPICSAPSNNTATTYMCIPSKTVLVAGTGCELTCPSGQQATAGDKRRVCYTSVLNQSTWTGQDLTCNACPGNNCASSTVTPTATPTGCALLNCGPHGSCDPATLSCVCDTCYHGPHCEFAHRAMPLSVLIFNTEGQDIADTWADIDLPGPSSANAFKMYLAPQPNMNRIRREGVVFPRGYVSSPKCSPSRFSILTGRYSSNSWSARYKTKTAYGPAMPPEASVATVQLLGPDKLKNLQTVLRKRGYVTGITGKYHVSPYGNWNDYVGTRAEVLTHGWEYVEALYYSNIDQEPFGQNLEWIAAASREIIRKANAEGRPFFLYVNPVTPNGPQITDALTRRADSGMLFTPAGQLEQIPDSGMPSRASVWNRTQAWANATGSNALKADRAGGLIWQDDLLGALLSELDALGLYDNTLVVINSDHAAAAKGEAYEEGLRIPFAARLPGVLPAGLVFPGLVSNIDLAPVVAELAGLEREQVLRELQVDGESFLQRVNHYATFGIDPGANRALVTEITFDRAVVTQSRKYIYKPQGELRNDAQQSSAGVAAYHPNSFYQWQQLYQLDSDVAEQINVFANESFSQDLAAALAVLACHVTTPVVSDAYVQTWVSAQYQAGSHVALPTCARACPQGCLACTQDLRCVRCNSSLFLLPGLSPVCVPDCTSQGAYFNDQVSGICVSCADGCATCNGPTETDCKSCVRPYIFMPASGRCVLDCMVAQGYPDPSASSVPSCAACSAITSCDVVSCTGPSDSSCLECSADHYQVNSSSCAACKCLTVNTIAGAAFCDKLGQCPCKPGVTGLTCNTCTPGQTYLSPTSGECLACQPVANCAAGTTCTRDGFSVCGRCCPPYLLVRGLGSDQCLPSSCGGLNASQNVSEIVCANSTSCTDRCVSTHIGNAVPWLCQNALWQRQGTALTPTCKLGLACNASYSYRSASSCQSVPHGSSCQPACISPLEPTPNASLQCYNGSFTSSEPTCTYQPCQSSCLVCQGPTELDCLSCPAGLLFAASKGRCVSSCSLAQGYTNPADPTACLDCTGIAGCQQVSCSSATNSVCDKCETDRYSNISASVIKNCIPCNCSANALNTSCQSDGQCWCKPGVTGKICDTCVAGQTYAGAAGLCLECTRLANCSAQTCLSTGLARCTQCTTGYFVNQTTGTCAKCTAKIGGCLAYNCSNASSSTCLLCDTNRYLTNNDTNCKKCGCLVNNTQNWQDTCNSGGQCPCLPGYSGFTCNNYCGVVSNCASQICQSNNVPACTQCNTGYYISGTSCIKCTVIGSCVDTRCTTATDQKCLACVSDRYLTDGNTTCRSCNCMTNHTVGAIDACNTGGQCNCIAGYTGLSCDACASGYFRDATLNCIACTQIAYCDVETCTGPVDSKCATCAPGYYASADGLQCLQCNCVVSNTVAGANLCNAIGQCNCSRGYRGLQCQDQCPTGCSSCNNTGCLECNSGFLFVPSQLRCVAKCDEAQAYTNPALSTECLDCQPVQGCLPQSLVCTSGTDQRCLACQSGRYLSAGSTICANCSCVLANTLSGSASCLFGQCSCISGVSGLTCNTCVPGQTYLNPQGNGACLRCANISNCVSQVCQANGVPACTECNTGYFLSNGACTKCTGIGYCADVRCTTSTDQKCAACAFDRYLAADSLTCPPCGCVLNHTNSDATCDKGQCHCVSPFTGLQCQTDPTACTGSVLSGSTCPCTIPAGLVNGTFTCSSCASTCSCRMKKAGQAICDYPKAATVSEEQPGINGLSRSNTIVVTLVVAVGVLLCIGVALGHRWCRRRHVDTKWMQSVRDNNEVALPPRPPRSPRSVMPTSSQDLEQQTLETGFPRLSQTVLPMSSVARDSLQEV